VFRSYSNDVVDLAPVFRHVAGRCVARCELPAGLLNGGQFHLRPMLKSTDNVPPVIPDRAPLLQIDFDVPNKALIISGRVGVVAPIIPAIDRAPEQTERPSQDPAVVST
jgi:hypothetical protein